MAVSQEELQAFHRFAQDRINSEAAETLHELVDSWEIANLSEEDTRENIAAIDAAVRDMQNGDAGRDAKKILGELRAELNYPE